MSTSHDFSNNYVVLVPQGLSFYDLFKMLWSNEIDQMGFVHSQKDREDYLQNRLMVVLFSLLFQKLLLLFSKLLAKLGSMVEFCLNLVSSNGGLLMLQGLTYFLFNFLLAYNYLYSSVVFVQQFLYENRRIIIHF